jgi:hypothetical protein
MSEGDLDETYQTGPTQTLLIKSRQSISNAIGARFTRGMTLVSLAFKRRIQDRFSAHLELTNKVCRGPVWTYAPAQELLPGMCNWQELCHSLARITTRQLMPPPWG